MTWFFSLRLLSAPRVLVIPARLRAWITRLPSGPDSEERAHFDRHPRQAMTALRPHSSASSRFAAFRIQKPPTCSLVSSYGPSVIHHRTSGCARRDFALLAGERPPAKILAPAASISSL